MLGRNLAGTSYASTPVPCSVAALAACSEAPLVNILMAAGAGGLGTLVNFLAMAGGTRCFGVALGERQLLRTVQAALVSQILPRSVGVAVLAAVRLVLGIHGAFVLVFVTVATGGEGESLESYLWLASSLPMAVVTAYIRVRASELEVAHVVTELLGLLKGPFCVAILADVA